MEFRRSIQRKAPRNGCTCRARNGGAAGDFGQRFVCQDGVRIQKHDDVADIFGHDLQLGARCGLGTELHDLFGNTSAVAPRPEGFVSAIALGGRLDPFVEDACPFGRIDRPCLSQREATWEKSGAAGWLCREKTPALPALRRRDLAQRAGVRRRPLRPSITRPRPGSRLQGADSRRSAAPWRPDRHSTWRVRPSDVEAVSQADMDVAAHHRARGDETHLMFADGQDRAAVVGAEQLVRDPAHVHQVLVVLRPDAAENAEDSLDEEQRPCSIETERIP